MEGLDSKNDSIRDRNNSLKRTGGSSRTDYEDTDYVEIKESRSKHEMKKQEESSSTLDKLSSWYKDGEHEKGKSNIKYSDKSFDYDRSCDRDRYLEKNETDQDKDYVSSEQGRSRRKIWDDTDAIKNVGNYDMGRKNLTDIKNESEREISIPGREDGLEERNDSENRARSRDKSEALEEEKKGCSLIHEEKSEKGKIEHQRSSVSRNNVETREIANFEMEQERGGVSKRKEPEKEGYRDDRYKGRDHEREWEVGHRRFGGRRDTALKTSSNFGVSDVIEIQTKPFETKFETKWAPKDEQAYAQEITKKNVTSGAVLSNEDLSSTRYLENGLSPRDQNSWRDENEFQDNKNKGQRNNTMSIRNFQGSRGGRGGRGRPQPYGPMPMMGSPFGPIGMLPPGQNLSPLNPNLSNLSPSPAGPPMSPNIFMPPFPPPLVWPGARGLDMNLLAFSQNLSPVPPGSSGPRPPFNLGNLNPPNPAFFSNQTALGRGEALNSMIPSGRGQNQDKGSGYEFSSRTIKPPGKAPSRGEQNDYSQNFVDTGMRPQNYIRELELTAVVEDYPRLRELIQKKDEIVANSNTAPMYYKCDLREHVLSPEFFGTKFDVILVDPPWEEYVHRAPGVTDHMEYWTFEEIMNLKIEAIADTPSFIFLWVGDGVGLEQGRQCLKKWGFRRCEDICWVKTNKTNATPGLRHDSHTLFQRSKEHCLMGIKGTVRRSTDGHVIHANIDTDVIIAEEPPYGSTAKPEDMYRIVEHFALGRRRLELFGEDHNIRAGWLTVGNGLSSSNFNAEGYVKNFADKDGKVWQGGGGRNPPPEAPHLVVTTPDIEALRPKSPMKNQLQLQLQQQSSSVSVTVVNNTTNNRMPTINQEASSSSFPSTGPWGTSGNMGSDDRDFDMYSYNMNSGQSYEEYREFQSRRVMNLM